MLLEMLIGMFSCLAFLLHQLLKAKKHFFHSSAEFVSQPGPGDLRGCGISMLIPVGSTVLPLLYVASVYTADQIAPGGELFVERPYWKRHCAYESNF